MLDTSFLIAYYDKRDQNHDAAAGILHELEAGGYGAVFLSEYAFDETVTILKKYLGEKEAGIRGEKLLGSLEMIWADSEVFRSAWTIFKKFHKLSFTDCYQIAAMKHHGIEHIATFDSDFEGIVKVIR